LFVIYSMTNEGKNICILKQNNFELVYKLKEQRNKNKNMK